ncbi:ead/Ea22-like family protein [Salmonella enterica]|nr:ead/Ea22-like family protein [Salmonella enterica]ECH4137283.1 ead/Ea22-like family protein [Salmonella enterica]ECJ3200476.1 ead/Ea22-like family protein [Salmonella enterica]ECK0046202.1 ead/Ea22-like family protein [Salmonella enterica]ECK1936296.1 ead/Ea22-like family protein [Salmonella enterica]
MSNIDKRALREAAEKAGKDKWQAKKINGDFYVIRSGSYIKQCGITSFQPIAEIDHKPVRDFVAMVNPATTLALLDENLQFQREKDAIEAVALALRDDMRQAREQLEAAEKRNAEQQRSLDHRKFLLLSADEVQRDFAEALGCAGDNESIMEAIDDLKQHIAELESKNGNLRTIAHDQNELAIKANLDSINYTVEMDRLHKRIAELENSETQLINERDVTESALADMYQAATGERPEWSNMFGFADAVDVVEERLATLEANQSQTTPTGIQLITEAIGAHGYIVGCLLQGRPDLALEESRKWVSAFGQAAEIVSAQDAADIGVKGGVR